MIYGDPRMRVGAYITDGADLYEVTGIRRGPGALGMSTVRIGVQNCRNLRHVEFLPDKVRGEFKLVREAPVGQCPNVVDDIPWDADLAA
jgi:hypothetical protein